MYVIGVDVGTTGTKALVLSPEGEVVGRGYQEYDLYAPVAGWVEQNAEDWWNAAVASIRQATQRIDRSQIAALSVSAQGASLVPVDAAFRPLSPVMTWMDSRAQHEVEVLNSKIGDQTFYYKSGWKLNAGFDAAKIAWLRNHRTKIYDQTAYFLSTLDFMNCRMTGHAVIDPTSAAIRQLMDIHTQKWDTEILDVLALQESRLPKILPVGQFIGNLTTEAAEELDLNPDTKVFNGAHDQYCAAIGSGTLEIGDMLLATGTAWVVFGISDRLLYTDKGICPGLHPIPDRYGAMVSMQSGGSALKWLTAIIDEDYQTIDRQAARCRESASDILFYPYLAGAGQSHQNPNQRAVICGMDIHHTKFDLALALMEGVAFETQRILEIYQHLGMSIKHLTMTGGASRSDLWCSIISGVTGSEINRMEEVETCCIGAAMLAAVGLQWYDNLTECASQMLKSRPIILNDRILQSFYQEKYQKYMECMKEICL